MMPSGSLPRHSTEALKKLWSSSSTYTPAMEEGKRGKLFRTWKKAVTKSFDWVDTESDAKPAAGAGTGAGAGDA